jgi:hypothetical protein
MADELASLRAEVEALRAEVTDLRARQSAQASVQVLPNPWYAQAFGNTMCAAGAANTLILNPPATGPIVYTDYVPTAAAGCMPPQVFTVPVG